MARKTTPTHVLLNQITLAASSSSVTFSNIPQGYGDLVLIFNGKTSANIGITSTYNGDSSNQSRVAMYGTPVASGSWTDNEVAYSSTGDTVIRIQWVDYSATDKHKTALTRSDAASAITLAAAQRWASTAAISSILLSPKSSNTFSTGSTFSLYGVYA